MNKQLPLIIFGTIAFIIAVITASFFFAFERTEETVDGPPTGLARQNPYLALQHFFNLLERDADTNTKTYAETYAQLPNSSNILTINDPYDADIIIWMAPKHDISPTQIKILQHWISNGGHLIATAPQNKNDPLISPFDLKFNQDFKDTDNVSPEKHYKFDHPYATTPSWKNPDADHEFYDSDNKNIFAHSQPYNQGRLTFFADNTPFKNFAISKDDHAQLILDITRITTTGDLEDTHISIIQHGQRISWVMHVLTQFWPLAITLALLLLLAITQGLRRFGPLQIAHTTNRRSRLEHIHAVGRFLWKNDAENVLLNATREALLDKLKRRRPAISALHGQARYELIAEELDISPIAAKRLFEAPVSTRPNLFLESIQNLENYRRNL